MPSVSLNMWLTPQAAELNEIENAHRTIGGVARGRRYATQQINHAYAVLLSSQFQRFCRDLHSECIDHIVRTVTPPSLQTVLRAEFVLDRKLDKGNPNPGNIGADFNRLGVAFWMEVQSLDARNRRRQQLLEELNRWRNAIAHQDFAPSRLGGTTQLQLSVVRRWRRACNALALSFDEVMAQYIARLTGVAPW